MVIAQDVRIDYEPFHIGHRSASRSWEWSHPDRRRVLEHGNTARTCIQRAEYSGRSAPTVGFAFGLPGDQQSAAVLALSPRRPIWSPPLEPGGHTVGRRTAIIWLDRS